MLYLAHVLQLVVHGLYYRALAQQDLIVHSHKAVLHVVSYSGDQLDAIRKKYLYQFLGDIPLVCEEFAEYFFQESLAFQRFAIIYAGLCYGKVQYLTPVVYHQVQLEAQNQPIVDLPTVVMPLNTLLACIRLFFQTLIGLESAKDMPEKFPKQQDLRNMVIGSMTLLRSSTNLL